MAKKRRGFTREDKLHILAEKEAGKPVSVLVREYEISANQIYRWQRELKSDGENAFAGQGHTYKPEARIAEIERMVGQLTLENALLKKAWERKMARTQS